MQRLAISAALFSLVACGVGSSLPAVNLPARTTAAPVETGRVDAVPVTLTASGRIYVRNRACSLADLAKRTVLDRAAAPVALRIDRSAPWRHVQWIVDALGVAQGRDVMLAYSGAAGAEAHLTARRPRRAMSCVYPASGEGFVILMRLLVSSRGRIRCEGFQDAAASILPEWLADLRRRCAEDGLIGFEVVLAPEMRCSWGEVAWIYERLHAGGARRVYINGFARAPDRSSTRLRLRDVIKRKSERWPEGAGGLATLRVQQGEGDWFGGYEPFLDEVELEPEPDLFEPIEEEPKLDVVPNPVLEEEDED